MYGTRDEKGKKYFFNIGRRVEDETVPFPLYFSASQEMLGGVVDAFDQVWKKIQKGRFEYLKRIYPF